MCLNKEMSSGLVTFLPQNMASLAGPLHCTWAFEYWTQCITKLNTQWFSGVSNNAVVAYIS